MEKDFPPQIVLYKYLSILWFFLVLFLSTFFANQALAVPPEAGLLRGRGDAATDGNDSTYYLLSKGQSKTYSLAKPTHITGYYFRADSQAIIQIISGNNLLLQFYGSPAPSSNWTPIDATGVTAIRVLNFDTADNLVIYEVDVRGEVPDTTPPAAPAGLTASLVSDSSVILTWQTNTETDLAGYKIYRNGMLVAQVTGTSWQDTAISPQTTYTYEVRAYDTSGNLSNPASVTVTTPPPPDTTQPLAPVGLTATATGPTSVQLAWQANTESDLSGYKVYRDGVVVADVPPTATSWTDTTVQPGTQYTYTLKAYDASGNFSDPSVPAIVTTPADTTPPAAPTGLTASQVNYNSVTLTWAANTEPDLAGYKVYRNGMLVAQVTGTNWQDSGVSPQTTYTYEVRAYDQAGNLSSPASIAVTTPAAPPDPPRAELTAVTNTSITITWTPPAQNIQGYRIYKDGQLVDTVPPDQTTYTLAGLEGGRAYEVWVTSYNDAGESAPSNVIKSTPSFLSLARLGDMLENLWMLFRALLPLIAFVLALLAIPHLVEIVKQALRRRRAY